MIPMHICPLSVRAVRHALADSVSGTYQGSHQPKMFFVNLQISAVTPYGRKRDPLLKNHLLSDERRTY